MTMFVKQKQNYLKNLYDTFFIYNHLYYYKHLYHYKVLGYKKEWSRIFSNSPNNAAYEVIESFNAISKNQVIKNNHVIILIKDENDEIYRFRCTGHVETVFRVYPYKKKRIPPMLREI